MVTRDYRQDRVRIFLNEDRQGSRNANRGIHYVNFNILFMFMVDAPDYPIS